MSAEKKIIDAFVTLIQQQDFTKITISAITQQAGVTRTYFYQFFDDKVDLAREAFFTMFQEILSSCTEAFKIPGQINPQSTLTGITFALTHRQVMQQLLAVQDADFNLQTEFQGRIKQIIKQSLYRYQQTPDIRRDYFAELFAASALTTIQWLLQEKRALTPDTVVEMINLSVFQGMINIL